MADVFGAGTAIGTGRAVAAGGFNYVWQTKTPITTARYGLRAGEIGGVVYVVGGYSGSVQSRTDAWDTVSQTWTAKASLPFVRHSGQVAVCNGKLYWNGGLAAANSSYFSNTFEYDPTANTWTQKANAGVFRGYGTAATVGSTIYFFGGRNAGTLTTTVEQYTPATDTWATKATAFPTARDLLACAEGGDGFIYITGGHTGSAASNLVHRYDPAADTYTARTVLPAARYGHGMARKGAAVYSAGGFTTAVSGSTIAYDNLSNTWSTKPTMGTARYYLAVSTGGAGIYAMGGFTTTYSAVNEYLPVPEVEGVGSAIGRGVTVTGPLGAGTLRGAGVVSGGGEVVFSGRTMQPGPIRVRSA